MGVHKEQIRPRTTSAPWYYLTLLILAGEAVFILPFVLPRIFRPTVLEVFEMSNFEYNLGQPVYGIVAMISYVLGGPLADKYSPRKLIAISLWMTAIGGLVYASFPDLPVLQLLYGYWGFTTIFLFWAPMIKATRVWGGETAQGRAFGFLDGGRGLTGALFGLLGVLIFSFFINEQIEAIVLSDRQSAYSNVIYVSSLMISVIGVLVWLFMKTDVQEKELLLQKISIKEITTVLRIPAVWLLMIIILCAYVGYKITDVISQYANEVMEYNQVKSARIGTFLQFLRPTVGILVGLLVDRFRISLWLTFSFVLMMISGLLFATGILEPSATILFLFSIVVIATGVYGARSLYFGVMRQGRIPLVLTGTAVGLISLVGYTPDIFAGPAYGYFLDTYPGEQGHQYVFWMLIAFAAVGTIASFFYYRLHRN